MSTEREQVKRYRHDYDGMWEDPKGAWIDHDSYLSEHERAERLEKALRAIIDECPKEEMWSGLYGAMQEYRYYKVTEAAIESGKAALGGQSD